MTEKIKYIYILFLLILVSLLIFIVQGISNEEITSAKEIEFNRVDGYNEKLGKITRISAAINNKDTINHNYTISSYVDSNFFASKTVEVFTDLPFTYSITIPLEKKYNADNEFIDAPTHIINFTVYRDDRAEPIDQIEFRFN